MNTYVYLWPFLIELFLEMFETKVVEKIKTHFMFDNPFFENLNIYKIMSKNIVVILISYPLQWWLCELTSLLHYMYFACLVLVFNLGQSVA